MYKILYNSKLIFLAAYKIAIIHTHVDGKIKVYEYIKYMDNFL